MAALGFDWNTAADLSRGGIAEESSHVATGVKDYAKHSLDRHCLELPGNSIASTGHPRGMELQSRTEFQTQ
ncbi:hypothetical protein OAF56_01510 [Pirellulaceae bacterium]|nr:hypothetical protein [Pirellulaceae bacterium]